MDPPEENIHDDNLKVVNNTNYLKVDEETLLNKDVDTKRLSYIKKLKLESNFFNVFRNTIRIILNKYENIKIRDKIENIMKDPDMLYLNKLKENSIIQH